MNALYKLYVQIDGVITSHDRTAPPGSLLQVLSFEYSGSTGNARGAKAAVNFNTSYIELPAQAREEKRN